MSADSWARLGLTAKDADVAAVRRAYAAELRSFDPDTDPARFQSLRTAYEFCLAAAGSGRRRSAVRPPIDAETFDASGDCDPTVQQRGAGTDGPNMQQRTTLRIPPSLTDSNDLDLQRADLSAGEQDSAPAPGWSASIGNRTAEATSATDEPEDLLAEADRRLGGPDPDFDDLAYWRALLDDPRLMDFLWSRQLEQVIADGLLAHLLNGGDLPTREWEALLEARFGWRQDGVGFRRRYARAEPLLALFYPEGRSVPMSPRPPNSNHEKWWVGGLQFFVFAGFVSYIMVDDFRRAIQALLRHIQALF